MTQGGAFDDAVIFLRQVLKDGPVPVADVQAQARATGISERTLDRAKAELGIAAQRQGPSKGGRWVWELPEEAFKGCQNAEGLAPFNGIVSEEILEPKNFGTLCRPLKVVHVSWQKRDAPDNCPGGVEKFAMYLRRALQEAGHQCLVISWSDYPSRSKVEGVSNPDKALLLGAWIEHNLDFDIAVSDGYWGAGILNHPVLPVIHGTWAQFHLAMGSSPWTNIEVRAQHAAFNAVNAFPVACSPASARELVKHHRRQPEATILHGVDLEEFSPLKTTENCGTPVVLEAAGKNAKKGAAILPTVARELAPDFLLTYLSAKPGEEARAFQRGEIFLHPAKHEGNAYSLLEAMAVGLPIVTTPVGLFEDIPDRTVGRILPVGSTVKQWADAVREVWGDGVTPYRHYARAARQAAKDLADFETFKAAWVALLAAVLKKNGMEVA